MGDWTKEPWEFDFFNLKATHEIWPSSSHPEAEPIVVLDPRDYERATNCVNAMCGIPDPAKFVEAFDAMVDVIRLVRDDFDNNINPHMVHCGKHPYTISRESLNDALDLALAAKPTDPPNEET